MRIGTGILRVVLLVLGLLLAEPGLAQSRPLSQVQVARRFWRAGVGQHWRQAYGWLTPVAQAQVSKRQFRQALQPLQESVRQFGPTIDLYKLGFRLRETAAPEIFVAYSFRADTLAPRPYIQLEVSFQDSTARLVQRFRLVRLTR